MVGRVWPRHGHRGRPLNSVVRHHMTASRGAAWIWSVLGVPVAFAVFIAIAYAKWGPLPFFSLTGESLLVAFLVVICLSGAIAVRIALNSLWGWAAALVYFLVMGASLPWVGLVVACFNGDCI
jgi:hypothetical protein